MIYPRIINRNSLIIDFKKKYYNGVDMMKYIMAVAVIIIHIGALWNITYPFFVTWFIRLAVPYFFIVSGYFIFKGATKSDDRKVFFRHRSYQLFRLFIIWLTIYSPISIWYYVTNNYTFIDSLKSYIISVVISGESYLAWPLWYIYSFAIFCFIFSLNNKKSFFYYIGVIYILVYIIGYVYSYSMILSTPLFIKYLYVLTHRTLGGGIYLIAGAGILLAQNKQINILYGLILFPFSILLKIIDLPFWQLFGGMGLFLLSLKIDLRDIGLWSALRLQSMWIYYSHMILLFLLDTCLRNYNYLLSHQFHNISICIISILLCCIFGLLLYKLSRTKYFNKMNLLIK